MRQTALCTLVFTMTMTACKGGGVTGDAGRNAMGAYAKGYNLVIANMPDLFQAYYSNVPKEGLTPETLSRSGASICRTHLFLGVDKPATVTDAFKQAKDLAPKELEHLGPMADELANVMNAALADHETFCKYVEAEDYKDDGGKAAAAHLDKIVGHQKAYTDKVRAFSSALDEVEFKQMESEVARYEGKSNYRYWYRHLNLESKRFLREVENDPGNFDKHYQHLAEVHAEFTKFVDGKGADLNETFGHYRKNVDSFVAEAKKLSRAARDAKGEERVAAVHQGFGGLVSGYNSVIGWTETFSQLEQVDQL